MIKKWLDYKRIENSYSFNLVHITEKSTPDDSLVKFLQEKIMCSYRSLKFYEFHFDEDITEEEIRKYIIEQVIPKDDNQFDRNVRQGDWGEILAGLIAIYYQNLIIPINKLQWKFNKNKAVFGTDLLAFNNRDTIEDIYYYEIKTRRNPNNKEGKEPDRNYISVLAHNSLVKDDQSPTESIADFLERLYVEKEDFDTAKKFKDIVKYPEKYNKKFELFFIIERCNFIEAILDELEALPPQLDPLNVTILFIDNLGSLVEQTWTDIENSIVKIYSRVKLDD